jgi:hypothetical protein
MTPFRFTFILLVFFGGLFFVIRESTPLDNTLGGAYLFWYGAAAGLGCGLVASWLVVRGPTRAERVVQMIMMTAGFVLTCSAAGSFINRKFSSTERAIQKCVVLHKGSSRETRRSPAEYYLYLKTPNGEERVQVERRFWAAIADKSTIRVSAIPGFFKFPYIESDSFSMEILP